MKLPQWKIAASLAAPLFLILFSGCPPPQRVEPPLPPTPPPEPTPPPTPYVPNKRMETGRMFNGMQFRTTVITEFGTTATAERNDPSSYTLDLQVRARIPKPHRDLAEISKLNPKLPTVLPGLPILLDTAKVSPFYEELYRRKVTNLQNNLVRLDNLLSRHNFYDCETILELEHPISKRKALIVQSDMDTDMDGSDSDRVPEVDGSSATFQPFTSYKWPKKTQQPNSFIVPRDTRLKQIQQELATPGLSAARQKELKTTQTRLLQEIGDLQKHSFLVGSIDPFIVLPGGMFTPGKPHSPMVGDYCVVIHNDVLYPAILGDVGPTYKMGEGSLRLCQQLNPKASAYNRAASDLKVTYLVFPGSGERPWDVPNLGKWRAACEKLLGELGGFQGELHTWEELPKPVPPATPATPPASPAPVAGATPAPSPSPAAGTPARTPPAPQPPGTPAAASPTPAAQG